MSEMRRIKAADDWTILVHPSGSIEAHDADRAVWVGLDSDDCLSVDVDGADVDFEGRASSNSAIPADVARAVLNQAMPLPAELSAMAAVEAALSQVERALRDLRSCPRRAAEVAFESGGPRWLTKQPPTRWSCWTSGIDSRWASG